MSPASVRLRGKFGIFGCGSSRKKASLSGLKSGRRATDANEGTSALAWACPLATTWQLAHHRLARSAPCPASAVRADDVPQLEATASRRQIRLKCRCIGQSSYVRLRPPCSSAARPGKLGEVDPGDDRPQQPSNGTMDMPCECRRLCRGQAKTFHIKALGVVRHVPLPGW